MEKIKVNMNPNPLDVQTIHASQNDGEARQWEFELHNNGELIDTSEITEQLFFKAYKGGTEQILPENTSTPTTSPFKGDIKYPQGLLTDQEFLYRQSPTEEDGLAKITDIKGNTLVWNQLLNVEAYTTNTSNGVTFTKNSNNTISITGTATGRATSTNFARPQITNGHKYLLYLSKALTNIYLRSTVGFTASVQNSSIFTATADGSGYFYLDTNATSTATFNITDLGVCLFDLTKMFGSGNEPSSVEEFTSLFPLSYYSYNQGSLLSFNGNGIKTVGKNLLNINNYRSMGSAWTLTNGVLESNNNSYKNYVSETIVGTGHSYTLSFKYNVSQNRMYAIQIYNRTDNVQLRRFEFQSALTNYSVSDVLENGKEYDIRVFGYSATSGTIKLYDVQLELGDTATTYEPYTSSTLSLPISTYFPSGMKSAGSVYDELTESKAITRVGVVDLGTLPWNAPISANPNIFYCNSVSEWISLIGDRDNAICSKYERYDGPISGSNLNTQMLDKQFVINKGNHGITGNFATGALLIKDSSYSTVQEFKTAMNGVLLYYELATPTETSFTTASLVTENAEIPLSNEDGTLIGKCTEQLSENPGFIDAKIKLSDEDGKCYSNKIQLHVERSPQ